MAKELCHIKDIRCKTCGKKLFESESARGSIIIKCPKCKMIQKIDLVSHSNSAIVQQVAR